MMPRTISIIIPVFNEQSTVAEALSRAMNEHLDGWNTEIIVVNDGSTDRSSDEIDRIRSAQGSDRIKILCHDTNKGKGAAVKTALPCAAGDYILIHDADLEYDTADWQTLVKEIPEDANPVIYGSRAIRPRGNGYSHYVLGARILTAMANLLFAARLTDMYTGYKLIPTNLLRGLNLVGSGFEFEAEVTAKILKQKIPIGEVAVHYYPRTFKSGKKIRFRDAVRGARTLIANRFMN